MIGRAPPAREAALQIMSSEAEQADPPQAVEAYFREHQLDAVRASAFASEIVRGTIVDSSPSTG